MRPGWQPTRRNRNIGTSKQGHGRDNALVVPQSWWDKRHFFERLFEPIVVTRRLHGDDFHIIVETTRADCVHPCTVDDVFHVLSHLPPRDLHGLRLVVLRQPKRKEQILSSVWGRLRYFAEYGRLRGPVVILEAQNLAKPLRWNRSLGPEEAAELARLRSDGHDITEASRAFVIRMTPDTARSTLLYRTLPHEIGHWVDWLEKVVRPAVRTGRPESAFERRYFARPQREREVFAHAYADRLADDLQARSVIPFARLLDAKRLESDGLRPGDFSV